MLFNIDPSHCNSLEQKLLYNIFTLLNKEQITEQINDQPKKKEISCKYCGGVHSEVGERLTCARKNKRKDD